MSCIRMSCLPTHKPKLLQQNVRKKVIPLADSTVGIGSLLDRIKFNEFQDDKPPSAKEDITALVELGNYMVSLGFFYGGDWGGKEYDRLRPVVYEQTSVFLLCFAINDRQSLENVHRKWSKEIEPYRDDAAVIIIGTKKDLRNDPTINKEDLITPEEGEAITGIVRGFAYVECSAKTSDGVMHLLQVIAGAALSREQSSIVQNSSCWIL